MQFTAEENVWFINDVGTRISGILTWCHGRKTPDTTIVIHGMFSAKHQALIALVASGLAQSGMCNTLRFDLTGNGRSGGEFTFAGYQREVDDVRCAAKWLQEQRGLLPRVVVGHSKGGAVALMCAALERASNAVAPPYFEFNLVVNLSGRVVYGGPEKRFTPEQLQQAELEGSFMHKQYGKEWKITQTALEERKHMRLEPLLARISADVLTIFGGGIF